MHVTPAGFIFLPGTESADAPAAHVFDVARPGEPRDGRVLVCKRLPSRALGEGWARERLAAEGRLLAALGGAATPRLEAAGEDAHGPWLVMERIDWPPLAQRMGAADPAWVGRAARVAFQALATVHAAGVVHADLSPRNVLVDQAGRRAAILDLGLAHAPGMPPMPPGPFRGTLLYAAPEGARGEALEARSDLFSLAASMLHVASGEAPRAHASEAAMLLAAGEEPLGPWAERAARGLAAPVATALVACCELVTSRRPASAAEIAGTLAGVDEAALRTMMLRLPLLQLAVVVLLGVVSGTLECGGHAVTAKQARGAHVYARMCAVCHGPSGNGYAADRAPSLTHRDFLAAVDDGYLRTAILEGRSGTTMSAWSSFRGGPLSIDDAAALVAFLRSWSDAPAAKLDDHPAKGDPRRGADLFARQCAPCHGERGVGGTFVGIGSPDVLRSATDGFLRQAVLEGRPGTPMPSFAKTLGPAGVDDVLAALRDWQRTSPPQLRPPAKLPPLPLGPVPLNPKGPEPEGFAATPQTTRLDVVKAQLDRGARMALLDARAPSDYTLEHIAGAVSVPFYDPDPYADQLPRDAWLVCYCSCPHAESGMLAQKLLQKGFTKVTVLDEGLRVWKAKNYPVHAGFEP